MATADMGIGEQMSADVLAAIIEHVGHPIFVKDRSFRFVLVNRALCDMLGYVRADLLGKTDYDFFPQAEADFFRAKDLEVIETGRSVTIEREPITDAAGQLHILSTTKVPLHDSTGEVTFLVGIINDITRLKQAEEALRQANEQLEQRVAERTAQLSRAQEALVRRERLAMLGQLAGGLAHQLRNPLGAISNASTLCEKSALLPAQRMALDVIREEVRRADRTIADLLDYARIRPPERRGVVLAEVVESALAQERIGEEIRVEVTMTGAPTAYIDYVQVETALGNVVRNALEAMPSGGKLVIAGSTDGERALLVVRDTGAGVPAAQVPVLFDPLVTTKPQGVGLGLSTARNLIENQGGTIQYTASVERPGAEFTVVLPARAPRQ